MTTESFRVTYDGAALRDGTMSVRDLAGALLAVGKAIEEANRVFNGDRAKISVTVKAVKPGSCTIELLCDQSLFQMVKDFFSGEDVIAISTLLSLLGFSVKDMAKGSTSTLLRFLKWARGRRVKKVVEVKEGVVTVVLDDGTQVDVPEPVLKLYKDVNVRRSLSDMTKPLEQEGIDTMATGDGGDVELVSKGDLAAFAPPEIDDEPLTSDEYKKAFSIYSLAFKDDNKWRLFDGQNTISAKMADEGFLKRIEENQETFTKGDILVCRIQTSQWRTAAGLKTEHTVLEVVEHHSAARQINLPLDRK